MKLYKNILAQSILLICFLSSCDKDEFLSKKPSSNIVVPTNIDEIRGLLDNESTFYETPLLGTQSSDEYYWSYNDWLANTPKNRNAYIWNPNTYKDDILTSVKDWNTPYNQVFVANVALEAANAIQPTSGNLKDLTNLKATAYFLRAKANFGLAEVFTLPYDENTAESDLGLALKLTSDINDVQPRSNLKRTYEHIINDLTFAKDLFSETSILPNRIRPTKLTAYALLARIYLTLRNYDLAGKYADSVLMNYNKIINYNGLTTFVLQNDETIYQNISLTGSQDFGRGSGTVNIDSNLLKLYSPNDLRLNLYFKSSGGKITFNVFYSALIQPFTGLATDEMYLIRAECYARNNVLDKSSADINSLLSNRYKTGTYTNVSFTDKQTALNAILLERRKELVFRGMRWSDVRRLNKEGANIAMTRTLNGQVYTLPPNDKRFALSIPQTEIDLSGILQNPR